MDERQICNDKIKPAATKLPLIIFLQQTLRSHAVEANPFGANPLERILWGDCLEVIAFRAIVCGASAAEAIFFRANTSIANSDY